MPRFFYSPSSNWHKVGLAVLVIGLACWLTSSVSSAKRTGASPLNPNGVQGQVDFIREISLPTNDLIFNPSNRTLHASVPSTAGSNGNSIANINPDTGAVNSFAFIGSEPNKLALSDNGQDLYAVLDGAASIRRFDIVSQTPGMQFPIGSHPSYGTYYADDIAVMPGHPESVAVSKSNPYISQNQRGVAIYDNGVQRPNVVYANNGRVVIKFNAAGSNIYCNDKEYPYPAFRKLAVDGNGVTNVTTTSELLPNSPDIKLDNGLLYSNSGKVINPETAALVGDFGSMGSGALVAPDSSVGRAYFLTGSGTTWTLRAFDQNNFTPVGTLNITGIKGTPTSLVRWGANGLAFRTSNNQVFLIQTTLVPSPEPIPTPTPTPSPTPTPTPIPVEANVRQLALTTNDLIYDASRQTIYATQPSAAGSNGNSLTPINPASGNVGSSIFVGSEPNKIAASDNGQYLYIALDGAEAVRRFDLNSQTPDLQFPLKASANDGSYTVQDMEVLPSNPEAVAVSRQKSGSIAPRFAGVVVYDNGVARPTNTNNFSGANAIEFSANASTLYGMDLETSSGFYRMAVNSSGVTNTSITQGLISNGDIEFSNGLIYSSNGQILNPETRLLPGRFWASGIVLPDLAVNRVYFLTTFGTTAQLSGFDATTFLPVGNVRISGIVGAAGSLLRWGANGLAFRTSGNQVFLIQTSLVPSSEPVPSPSPPPTPTPSPTPVPASVYVRQISLPTNDLIYDSSRQMLYTSVPGSAAVNGNSLTAINPQTGALGASVFIGNEPGKLAISDNNQFIYIAQNATAAPGVRRFDIASQTAGIQFPLGSDSFSGKFYVEDMGVLPGNPSALAVSRRSYYSSSWHEGIAVYDDGVARPVTTRGGCCGPYSNMIEFSASPSTLYGLDTQSGGAGGSGSMSKVTIDATGATSATYLGANLGETSDFKFDNGLLYGKSGRVVEPEARKLLGTFTNLATTNFVPLVLPDSAVGRVYFLADTFVGNDRVAILKAYDMGTFLPLGSVTIGVVNGTPTSLIRWGANGLAFRTSGDQVFLIQTSLIPSAETLPTFLQFSAANFSIVENSGQAATITVTRTGDISGASTVDYATGDGTATAGSDYVAATGTLTFAAGETMKSFNVSITDDALLEGNETLNLTLNNPSSMAALGTQATAVLNIIDDESLPRISIDDKSVNEEGPLGGGAINATFTVSLSAPSNEPVTVIYSTVNGTALYSLDYQRIFGTLTFSPGQTSKTLNVPIIGDTSDEPDETFYVNLFNATNATILDAHGLGTIIDNDPDSGTAGEILISEFRFSGPNGLNDEFVELYNNTDAPIDLRNYSLTFIQNASQANLSFATLPHIEFAGRGHLLITNADGYSLAASAVGDVSVSGADFFADNHGVALRRNGSGAQVDAVGFIGDGDAYREGAGLPMVTTFPSPLSEYSYVRKTLNSGGGLQDTNDNATDFALVATDAATFGTQTAQLGSPAPENHSSPVVRNNITVSLVDPLTSRLATPNFVRTGSGNSGTLAVRRRFTNNTGATVTRLRFRVFDITTMNTPVLAPPQADLRLSDSMDQTVSTTLGPITVKGTQIEQPPTQAMGGGFNSSMTVSLPAAGLANNESLDVQFLLNVVVNGRFRFFFTVEALP